MRIIKLLGVETSLTTASAFANAQLIRILGGAADTLITVKSSDGVTTGTITVKTATEIFIRKGATDTIAAAAAVKAVAVAFGD